MRRNKRGFLYLGLACFALGGLLLFSALAYGLAYGRDNTGTRPFVLSFYDRSTDEDLEVATFEADFELVNWMVPPDYVMGVGRVRLLKVRNLEANKVFFDRLIRGVMEIYGIKNGNTERFIEEFGDATGFVISATVHPDFGPIDKGCRCDVEADECFPDLSNTVKIVTAAASLFELKQDVWKRAGEVWHMAKVRGTGLHLPVLINIANGY